MKGIAITVLLFTALYVSALERKQFLHFDKSNDFPFTSVDNVMQDSHGFLWIGSSEGLARYDGYSFELYTTQDKKNGLPSNRIFCTFETSQGDILVGTNLGLVVYLRTTNTFKLLSYSCTPRICEDKNNQIWVATFDGIDVRDVKTLQIKKSFFCETDNNIKVFSGLACDSLGRVWTVTNTSGIYVFNTNTNMLQKHINSTIIKNIEHLKVISLAFDTVGYMWVHTAGNGLLRVDTASYTVNTYVSSSTDITTIGSNNIAKIYVDTQNNVWACCQYGYLNRYNRTTNNFERFVPQADNSRFINAKSVSCINQDKTGNYWVGTYGNGLYCLSDMYNNFKTFVSVPNFSNNSGVGQITSFAELDDGTIAMACDGDGIKLYNPKNNSIRAFVNNNQLRSQNLRKLIKHNGFLWGATWGGGIFKIDLKTNTVTNFVYDVNKPNGLNCNNIMGLFANDTALVLSTHGEGVAFLNFKTNVFTHKNNSQAPPFNQVVNNWINDITTDAKGNMWIATCYGLCKLSDNKITHFATTESENTISSFDVLSVLEDSRKQLWVLTSTGLDKFDYKTNSFKRMSQTYSLPTNLRSLTEDNDGNLWICAADKLIKITVSNNTVQVFDKNDGIVSGEIRMNSSFMATDGTLYFGSSEGFMSCNPKHMKLNMAQPRLQFRNLYVNYIKQIADSVYLEKALELSDTLIYEYTDDVISIEMAAILFGRINKIDYSYTFDKKHNEWLNLGKDRVISFTALKPGTHILTVRATVENGASIEKNLTIIVQPKWWMTWWFKILVTLLVSAFIAWIIYIRIQKIKNKNIHLEKLVRQRTIELEHANSKLIAQSETLSNQANSLQQQNSSLVENKLVIEMKNAQLEEALDSKDKLIGIIAHDFKNPLAAIHGMATLMQKHASNISVSNLHQYIENILIASTKLKDQMITVLDWAQGQMHDLAAKPIEINIETIIDDAIILVKESSSQKQIVIHTQLDFTLNALVDPRMMSTVIRNLLVNAIKFTPRGGTISVVVQEYDAGIEVSVIDSGVGMSADVVNSLFTKKTNHSSYGTENEHGTGLGLHICKSFLEKNEGTIQVKSVEGEGSVFSVSIPKGSGFAIKKLSLSELDMHKKKMNTEIIISDIDKQQTILVIDDDAQITLLLRQILEPYYTIFSAPDGNVGLQMARNIVPNLIISDITMPYITGVELCEVLKNDSMTNHIPIILITSLTNADVQRKSYLSGADDFVTKPFDNNVLFYKVKSFIDNRKKLSEKKYTDDDKNPVFELPESSDDIIIKRTLDFIYQNIADSKLDVNFVAEQIGLSRTQLWRKFKSTMGRNLSDYVFDLRMQKAKEMLETGKFRVSEIAYEVGFSSPAYFAKRFSEKYGVTPKEYADSKRK